jgi:ATP-dependent helicase HrpB
MIANADKIAELEQWLHSMAEMTRLPIDSVLPEILARAKERRALVIVAPPGAGKTTRVPPAILRLRLLAAEHPNLVLLQPRRVAARAVAQRMAQENNWELGREVGYLIRFEKKITRDTRLRVMTEGVLTRQIVQDPFLTGIGAVVLDEFHERGIHTDLAAAMLNEIRATVRPDLMLIVMSATLDAEPVAKFLGDCAIVRGEGKMHPVEVSHRPATHEELPQAIAGVVRDLDEPEAGDVLVFLPGAEEIRRAQRALEPIAQDRNLLVLPLHGSLSADEQTAALRPACRQKIILATNIAETSLTIEGVRTVIDSGLVRVAAYDPQRGMDRLELKRISQASAIQRAGRAGRTAPGRCIRLYSAMQERAMTPFEQPEIHRVDLASAVLAVHEFGHADPRTFQWYETPAEPSLAAAERLLAMLGAIRGDSRAKITRIGQLMLTLPVHPRIARLLIESVARGMTTEGATLAALLSEKDILRPQNVPPHERAATHRAQSDLIVRMELLRQAEAAGFAGYLRDEGIDLGAARQVLRARDQLIRLVERIEARAPARAPSDPELLRLPLFAYPDRVCRRRSAGSSAGRMVGGGGVKLATESAVHDPEFFLALDARQDERNRSREALVRIASGIDVNWLRESFPESIRRDQEIAFDAERDGVVARTIEYYRDLPLSEKADAPADAEAAGPVLRETLRPRAADIFAGDEPSVELLNRVALLRNAMPEHPWPSFDTNELAEVLAEGAAGKRSLAEIQRTGLVNLLRQRLAYPLDRLLEQHAPESIEVPSGSRIQLKYEPDGKPPVLAVRLQELFGWTQTPRIAAGRVPVLIHLLAPNFRPVQVTSDLKSFWSTTYFQVRKDLRVRYPKHAWPEDPLTAKPQAKGRSRR